MHCPCQGFWASPRTGTPAQGWAQHVLAQPGWGQAPPLASRNPLPCLMRQRNKSGEITDRGVPSPGLLAIPVVVSHARTGHFSLSTCHTQSQTPVLASRGSSLSLEFIREVITREGTGKRLYPVARHAVGQEQSPCRETGSAHWGREVHSHVGLGP